MWNRMKNGWSLACAQPFAICTLFIYNLAWGLVLYKLLQSIIIPLLHRYPSQVLTKEWRQIFWVEGQFQLLKTDLLLPYLWWAVALLGLRMILHPMLNAGVFYSLQHTEMNAGYRFVEGIRRLALPYFGIYGLQTLLSLAPLYWLVPYAITQYGTQSSYMSLGKALLPAGLLYVIFLFILQLGFLFLQMGAMDGRGVFYALLFFARHFLPALLAALGIVAVTLLLSAAVMASAFIWAGFLALIGLQAYRFVQMFLKMWAICTQYALWAEKS